MSDKERLRIEVLACVADGTMSLSSGGLRLGLSYRQMRRVRLRHVALGDAGLMHRLRGRVSNRRTPGAIREKVLRLCREKYVGFGPTLLGEYLQKDEQIELSHDTVWRWLSAEGLLPRLRRGKKHRHRRERRQRCGELVQMDGSWHDWFEGRRGWCCLMVMIDDATGRVWAWFYEKEMLSSALDVFARYAGQHGLPGELYVDRSGIYRSDKSPTGAQVLAGERPMTQFGRAMRNLKVELILANSPQAKGRVERVNGTLQDRLVKAMRLEGINDIEAANRLLEDSFLEDFNERFVVASASKMDGHRAVSEALLRQEMCEHHERRVGQDWCVQWRGGLWQIDKRHSRLGLAGKRVTIRDRGEGEIEVVSRGQVLNSQRLGKRPRREKIKPEVKNNQRWLPTASHPWKRGIPAAAKASSPTAPPPWQQEQRTVLLR